MYYDHPFFRLLQRAYRVHLHADVIVIVNRDGMEEQRVPYSEMSQKELAAVCHYIGSLADRLRESI